MYASFDRNSPITLSEDVLSLSWKGDARRGWLATGNSKKTVGVTYTEICDEDDFDLDPSQPSDQCYDPEVAWALENQAMRRNFNFREHSKEVCMAGWCEGEDGGWLQPALIKDSVSQAICFCGHIFRQ